MLWIRVLLLAYLAVAQGAPGIPYYGTFIGELTGTTHGVSGKVYAASEDSFYLIDFSYDGQGPDAHFWVGMSDQPDRNGRDVPDENGGRKKLRAYHRQNIIITLTDNMKIKDFKYLSVYCRQASASFGSLRIPSDLTIPEEKALAAFMSKNNVVRSGTTVLKDSRTIIIPRLEFDATGRDAFFLVGDGKYPSANGTKLLDENNSPEKLKSYAGEDVTLTLPEGTSWLDYQWLSIFSFNEDQSYAEVTIDERKKRMVPVKFQKILPKQANINEASLMARQQQKYLGKKIGNLKDQGSHQHGVSGTVYSASANTIIIEDFNFDGSAEAFILVGTTDAPSEDGAVVEVEGSKTPLRAATHRMLVLTLPDNKPITEFKWLSVYSKSAQESFGHVLVPSDLEYPRQLTIANSISGGHRTAARAVVIENMKQITWKGLNYDGLAPDAFFLCGKGFPPNERGTKIPDENGSLMRLHGYNGNADITITLPGDLTMLDIDWIAMYCITFRENFMHVDIPKNPNILPDPMYLMQEAYSQTNSDFKNCEVIIPERIQVAWMLDKDNIIFRLQAVTVPRMWSSFGISGDKSTNRMIGADVAVTYTMDMNSEVVLEDYYLGDKSQCSYGTSGQPPTGVCPDTIHGGSNDLKKLSAMYENGILEVVYSRPLATSDKFDRTVDATSEIAVIAAQGPLGLDKSTVLYHTQYYTKATKLLKFNRAEAFNCGKLMPPPPVVIQSKGAGKENVFAGRHILSDSNTRTFNAALGPTGGKRGYKTVTGFDGWGYAWWINGLLIPVLYVERGTTYTFVVEGGNDKKMGAQYHPFYITDSKKGGGSKAPPEELGKPGHLLMAGVTLDANNKPDVSKGIGRYCVWQTKSIVDNVDSFDKFEDYQKTLEKNCTSGEPGRFTWTPDENTPDTVYYQCFTHNWLGWMIKVKNPGEKDDRDEVQMEKSNKGSYLSSSTCIVWLLPVLASVYLKRSSV